MAVFEAIPIGKGLEANVLAGPFGKYVFEEFQRRVDPYRIYPAFEGLLPLTYRRGVVVGTNPFAAVIVGEIVGEMGLRLAKPSDIRGIFEHDALGLKGEGCVDVGLVLPRIRKRPPYRSTQRAKAFYHSIEEALINQVLKSAGQAELRTPLMVPLSALRLREYSKSKSAFMLAFELKEGAEEEVISAPLLGKHGQLPFEDIDERTGLPNRVRDSSAEIFVGAADDVGLNRLLFTNRYYLQKLWGGAISEMFSYYNTSTLEKLLVSPPSGRIVVVRDRTTQGIL